MKAKCQGEASPPCWDVQRVSRPQPRLIVQQEERITVSHPPPMGALGGRLTVTRRVTWLALFSFLCMAGWHGQRTCRARALPAAWEVSGVGIVIYPSADQRLRPLSRPKRAPPPASFHTVRSTTGHSIAAVGKEHFRAAWQARHGTARQEGKGPGIRCVPNNERANPR